MGGTPDRPIEFGFILVLSGFGVWDVRNKSKKRRLVVWDERNKIKNIAAPEGRHTLF